jgi:hypothetical protein
MTKEKDKETCQTENKTIWIEKPITIIIFGVIAAIFIILGLYMFGVLSLTCNRDNDILYIVSTIIACLSIAVAILIYLRQKKSNKLSDKILKEINENVLDIKSITQISNFNEHLKKRIKESEHTTFIFYFPFSIYPGFWLDGGVEFKGFTSELEQYNDKKYTNQFIFIGPEPDKQSANTIFTILGFKSEDELRKILQEAGTKFPDYINIGETTTDANNNNNNNNNNQGGQVSIIEQIKNSYKASYTALKNLSEQKKFVHIMPIDDPQNLPSSSFVLEVNGEQNLVFVDTFKILKEPVAKEIYNTNMDRFIVQEEASEETKKEQFEKLQKIFSLPQSYCFKNNIVSNLFFSSFLDICQSHTVLKDIKNKIKNKS